MAEDFTRNVIKKRVTELRALFQKYNVCGYLVVSNDEYMNEYAPIYAKRLEYITGFSGSNGIAIITDDDALFFTDGRYIQQSKLEIDQYIFDIYDIKDLSKFLHNYNKYIGYDPKLLTKKHLSLLKQLYLKPLHDNLIDQIWVDKPMRPLQQIYIYEEKFAGMHYLDKVKLCRQVLNNYNADAILISAADSICWLTNLRASDVEFSPLMLGYLLLSKDDIQLFVYNSSNVSNMLKQNRSDITFICETKLPTILMNFKGKILTDENRTSKFITNLLQEESLQHIQDPCQIFKACKNAIEVTNAIEVHIKDAIAVCEFLAYIDYNNSDLNEYDLGILLTKYRKQQQDYIMDSFPTICGFNENAAIIHYRAQPKSSKKISDDGILLIDSGGHYLGGSTDITRTIAIGVPNNQQKNRYTQVLKGHIALSTIIFPNGITGGHLDVLARQFLWSDCLDYAHGTGHGVGNFLSVHEGPQNISLYSNVILKQGMIVSNEPGYYLPNEYGIRIENLMYIDIVKDTNYLKFRNLTLVPYDHNMINYDMLNKLELSYIKDYYQEIRNSVYNLLSNKAQKWINKHINFINKLIK